MNFSKPVGPSADVRPFLVRRAEPRDVQALARLEQQIYAPLGTDVYGEEYMRCWLDVNPDGLIVAVGQGGANRGDVVAYHYSQRIAMDLGDHARLRTYNEATDDGFTRRTHVPNGNAVMCVTVCSIARGAGRALHESLFRELDEDPKTEYFLAFSRISGFRAYVESLKDANMLPNSVDLPTLAAWYAQGCSDLVGAQAWPQFARVRLDGVSPPTMRDPVLTSHVRHPFYRLAGMRADWMKDPESLNFAAMVLYKPRWNRANNFN